MIGYILSDSEKEQIQGQYYTPYEFFNCVQDINGVWFLFLTAEDGEKIFDNPQWNWILDLPEGEYTPPPPPPFPPTEKLSR